VTPRARILAMNKGIIDEINAEVSGIMGRVIYAKLELEGKR
jgi:hypothetical protein